ncbi:S1 domain-containing RNA-binding protein [Pseudalkalibacillus decolorationis]|uniref:S1 domain-containing RNA-binding protein n=1 Tax=Pseudalkalibacillus decolorationis TaxID=163879 RepID=UPI002147AE92|nr:S1 domain-containing RNA-binding protein [Pseudalkalibacillus decolorationis]
MTIEVGSKLQGKVSGITHFGAFVELPDGITGLVHISEVADRYVKDINEHLSVGDEVEVKVINVDPKGKIGLSIKKAKEQPKQYKPRTDRPRGRGGKPSRRPNNEFVSFEDKLNRFLKDSEESLSTLKRQTESKRGGRGARRG